MVKTSLRVLNTDSLLAFQWRCITAAKRLLGNDEECLFLLIPAQRERARNMGWLDPSISTIINNYIFWLVIIVSYNDYKRHTYTYLFLNKSE